MGTSWGSDKTTWIQPSHVHTDHGLRAGSNEAPLWVYFVVPAVGILLTIIAYIP